MKRTTEKIWDKPMEKCVNDNKQLKEKRRTNSSVGTSTDSRFPKSKFDGMWDYER